MTPRPPHAVRAQILRLLAQEDINFLLTNRIPRRLATRFVGWLSQVEQPLVRDIAIGLWRLFGDLDLSDPKTTQFRSMHDCFTRELKDGARPLDAAADILVSPCDAIVGACGAVDGTRLYQAKGFPYTLEDLLGDRALAERYRDGRYVTLRLTAGMYHRFHAPHNCRVEEVIYVSGDTWNVNPIALRRIERLFCKNERAVVRMRLAVNGDTVTLVLVAAILVASIRLHCLDQVLDIRHRGPNSIDCDAAFAKGQELGWFQHGSTALVFAPNGYALCDGVAEGARVRMGQPLMRVPSADAGGYRRS
jgi:phosphatidylserine decarboxylase